MRTGHILAEVGRVFWVYLPLIAGCAVWGARGSGFAGATCGALAGIVLWTATEYAMHRFAFHGFAPHWQHHEAPTDASHILAPLWLSLSGAATVWTLIWLAAGGAYAASVEAGLLAGYAAYEWVHFRIHSAAAGGRILRVLRKRHYYHHFADDRACYGVTSPVWDWVFQSLGKAPKHNAYSLRTWARKTETRVAGSR